ncbi:MAG: hypothetical protein LBJ89_00775 [Holosporales bacterium]|jgi:prophage antirepressor-like protein|nr:hypothetical protein [Holosporales bacterium]
MENFNETKGLQALLYDGTEIRTVQINGEIWWVAKDVCEVFGETNRNRAMQQLDEDERGYTPITTTSGVQQMAIVNEPGLYSMLFAMQPSEARGVSKEYITNREETLRQFTRWVTHEVLPQIRKHGEYVASSKIDDILNDPDAWIKLLTNLKEERLNKDKKAMLNIGCKAVVDIIDVRSEPQRHQAFTTINETTCYQITSDNERGYTRMHVTKRQQRRSK